MRDDSRFVLLLLGVGLFVARDPLVASEAPAGRTNPKDAYELVFVPSGEFVMGSAARGEDPEGSEPNEDEQPAHRVFVSGFYIGKYEVTVAQFSRFCRETGRVLHEQPSLAGPDHPNPLESSARGADHPVVNVSWDDARAYAEWAGLRLPTEAEWERAARAGTDTRFWWGNKSRREMANLDSEGTAPVGSFPPNPFGLHDTAGNVWELCSDWYSETYYAESPARDPRGPGSGTTKVHRGGSWMNTAYYQRPAIRYCSAPDRRSKLIGFRCAADP